MTHQRHTCALCERRVRTCELFKPPSRITVAYICRDCILALRDWLYDENAHLEHGAY